MGYGAFYVICPRASGQSVTPLLVFPYYSFFKCSFSFFLFCFIGLFFEFLVLGSCDRPDVSSTGAFHGYCVSATITDRYLSSHPSQLSLTIPLCVYGAMRHSHQWEGTA